MPLCLSYFPRGLEPEVLRNHAHYCRLHGYSHQWAEATHIAHPAMRLVYKYDLILNRLRALAEDDWLFFLDGDSVVFHPVAIDVLLQERGLLIVDGPALEGQPARPLTNMAVLRNTAANRALLHALMTRACDVLTLQIDEVDTEALLRPAGMLACNANIADFYVNVSFRTPGWQDARIFVVALGSLPLLRQDGRSYEFMAHDLNLQKFLVRQVNAALMHGQPVLRPASYPALSQEAHSSFQAQSRIALITLYEPRIESYARVCEHNLRRYCERHGYAFHVYRQIPAEAGEAAAGSWLKPWVLMQHLAAHDWVIWVDADTLMFNQSRSLQALLDGRDLLLAKDLGGWAVNSGVMGFRNTARNAQLLQLLWDRMKQVQDRSGVYTSMGDQFYVNEVLAAHELLHEAHVYDHLSVNTPPHLATDDSLLLHFINLSEPYRSAYMADMDARSQRLG